MTSADDSHELRELLAPLDCGPPVVPAALAKLATEIARTYPASLPDDYLAFLRIANGADGTLANGASVVLWQSDVLADANGDNVENGWMPGCLLIGSDGGNCLYGIDLRATPPENPYVQTEDVGIAWDYVLWSGPSLVALLRYAGAEQSAER